MLKPAQQEPSWQQRILTDTRRAILPILALSAAINLLMLTSPLYMLQVYDRVLMSAQLATLFFVSLMALVAFAGLGFFDALRSRVLAQVGRWLFRKHAPEVMQASLKQALANRAQSTKPLRDLQHVQNFVGTNAIVPFFDGPFAPFFVVIIFMLHWSIGVLTIVGGIILFSIAWFADRQSRQAAQDARLNDLEAMTVAEGFAQGADYLESAGMRDLAVQRYVQASEKAQSRQFASQNISGTATSLSKAIRFTLQSGALGLGAYLVIDPNTAFTPGAMIAGSILMSRALGPVEQSINAWRSYRSAKDSLEALDQLAASGSNPPDLVEMPEPQGLVTAESVAYIHTGASRPLFSGVTFTAEPGKLLGIIGPSGAGKTTLCRLLTGVETANQGLIRIDGAALGQWDKTQFGRTVGYLPQAPVFFDGTIAQNIARFDESAEDQDIVGAAQSVGAHHLILQLPKGYATMIGPRGARLSGGQSQMIGLARANFRVPKVLILDEPTAHLDEDGRRHFGNLLKSAIANRQTVIMSTHDKGVATACDLILILKPGEVSLQENKSGAASRLAKAAS